ncbi:FAD binding domain-containing protein [Amylostereum chailletii]|nr:FAD binding domain-containing protein [Amylostereum chailletii]
MFSKPSVLVVGAGPAGLVMALSLAQNGIPLRIIDKSDSHHAGSRGFGLQPRTFELFQSLGIVNNVLTLATPIPTMRAYKLPGGTQAVKTWDLYEKVETPWPDRPYASIIANGACLSQALLEEIMRKRLATFGVTVELGTELVALDQDAEGVTATIVAHHSSGSRETLRFKYVVGADGAKGSTRKLIGLTFQGETRDTDGMVWGDVEIRGLKNDFWHIWGKPGHFTIMARPLQLGEGSQFGIGITGQNFDPTDLAEPDRVKDFIRNETGRIDLEFGDFTWLSYFKPNMRMVNKFQEGRVFVVGDAAHVHSPTGGQGLNCSVQDSSNLAWKLSLVLKGMASPSLLSSYNTERLPVITQMLHATTQLYTHTVAKEKPLDTSTGTPDDDKASGWFRWRNGALHMYGINYRFSDIVLEERDATPQDDEDTRARAYQGYEGARTLRAGDRAPEAPGLVSADRKETDDIHLPSFFMDRDSNARNGYLVPKGNVTVVIVRPDSFIGGIVGDADGVHRYFSKVLGI